MSNRVAIGLLAVVAIVAVGCAGTSTQDRGPLERIVIKAGSTVEEVVAAAGEPTQKIAQGAGDTVVWVYEEGTELTIKGGKVVKTGVYDPVIYVGKKIIKTEEK